MQINAEIFFLIQVALVFCALFIFFLEIIAVGYREKIELADTQLIHVKMYFSFTFQSVAYPKDNFIIDFQNNYLRLLFIYHNHTLQEY